MGLEQADRYVSELIAAIEDLPAKPHRIKRVRHHSLPDVFYFRHRHHYVFFRKLSAGDFGVISILHESMDIPSRLKEDAEGDG